MSKKSNDSQAGKAGLSIKKKGRSFFSSTEKLGWITFVFLLFVIAWGAFVRASGSGAGCGSHWPLCNGQVIPIANNVKTVIEFVHRVTSGISLILCGILFRNAYRDYPSGSLTRRGATASLVFILMEAILGAGLVLLELVAENKSVFRTISLGVHLLNTFFLLAAVVLTARWAKQETQNKLSFRSFNADRTLGAFSVIAVLGMLILGASGAMTALGDTLFPATRLVDSWSQDFSPTSHFLIQLRIFHPVLAMIFTLIIVLFARFLGKRFGAENDEIAYLSTLLTGIPVAQILLGVLNILLLAPTVIQLGHLLLADAIWVVLILTISAVWTVPVGRRS